MQVSTYCMMVSALWFCIKGMLEMRMEDSFLSPMNEPQCGWCPFWSWEWRIWSAVKVNTYAWFVCCYGTISMGGFTLVLPRVKYLISVDLNLVSEWDWVMFPPGEKNLVDSASSHMLVSKIKPCTSKYKYFTLKLRMAHYISSNLFDSPLLLGYP